MSNLSSNTLFHFTSKTALLNILKNGFYARYCIEEYQYSSSNIEFAIPIVCFCDIPLTKIQEHSLEYGNYALGMKKKWAIENGITPIFYIQHNGKAYIRIKRAMDYLSNQLAKSIADKTFYFKQDERDALVDLTYIIQNTKPIEGISRKNGKNKIFYNEKEWRYYPDFSNEEIKLSQIPVQYIDFIKDKENYTKELEKRPLKYMLSDIKYIITNKDEEKNEIIEVLKMIDPKYNEYLVEQKLFIISRNQIYEDF